MFRNKEFRQFTIIFLLISLTLIISGFILNPAAGIIAIAGTVIPGTAFFLFTKARYRKIALISKQIDRVLHYADRFEIGGFEEGELSILYSDITKMTLRIRDQNDTLMKDKQYLADSLADIAHQLRTPLTGANLILSILEKNPGEQEVKALTREIEGLLLRMDWLITSLLKISRLDTGAVSFQSEAVCVNKLIKSALQPLAIPIELHGIEVNTNIPKKMIITGDSGWLSEAIQNILKNCMENTGENGRIDIICTDKALYNELIIRDNGAGFKKEDLPHLFNRFYRGSGQNASGYGIGLALCKMIITRGGGSVTANNHPQGGAEFIIRFPK